MYTYLNKDEYIIEIESRYHAKYIGDFKVAETMDAIKTAMTFYVENPDTSKGHTNYFGIFYDHWRDGTYICNMSQVEEKEYSGLLDIDTKEVVISKHRHDYVTFKNTDGFLDGGSAYVRMGGSNKEMVCITLKDGVYWSGENKVCVNYHTLSVNPEGEKNV